MPAPSPSNPAPVVHFEIGCQNMESTRAFYSALLGWQSQPNGPMMAMVTNLGEMGQPKTMGIGGHLTALGHPPHQYVTVYAMVAASVKARVVDRERRKYEGLSGLASLVGRYAGSSTVRALTAHAEDKVREAVLDELRPVLEARLRDIGDVTVNLKELAKRWRSRAGSFADAQPLLFGGTPMCAALRSIHNRFKRELAKSTPGTVPVLFALSDGDSKDGNPADLSTAFRSLGVMVVACFVSDHNVADPRVVFGRPQTGWGDDARQMFDLASPLPPDSEFSRMLLQKGWTIEPEAKLFVQANHSEIVEEFMSIVLGPLGGRATGGLLPPGV